jgi:hypothetical protein
LQLTSKCAVQQGPEISLGRFKWYLH